MYMYVNAVNRVRTAIMQAFVIQLFIEVPDGQMWNGKDQLISIFSNSDLGLLL